jgi:S1-C subfamily serine protease
MWLSVQAEGEPELRVQARGDRFTIGRDPACDLVLADERVSRRHAVLRVHADGRADVYDAGSANGTLVNGQRIVGPVLLTGGEAIQVGGVLILTSRERPEAGAAVGATVVGAVPPLALPAAGPTPSSVERRRLRRSVRVLWAALGALVVAGATVGVLVAVGVIGGSDPPPPAPTEDELVRVETSSGGRATGSGTGWVLDAAEGLVVTNQHVTNSGDAWRVVTPRGDLEATLVASAPCDDLALLRVPQLSGVRELPLARQSDISEGQTVITLGYPGTLASDEPLQVTKGVVSVARTRIDEPEDPGLQIYPNVVQFDASINPGNSGGPLVDLQGRLIGVNTISGSDKQNQNFAVGVDRVRELVPLLRAARSLGWTGVDPDVIGDAGVPPEDGVGIVGVVPGTPGAAAGAPGSGRITAVDGTEVVGLRGYCEVLAGVVAPRSAEFRFATADDRVLQGRIRMNAAPIASR